jgi:hypothetical protein
LDPGVFVLSESSDVVGADDYVAGPWVCDVGTLVGDELTLVAGQSATCTVTNDDGGPGVDGSKIYFSVTDLDLLGTPITGVVCAGDTFNYRVRMYNDGSVPISMVLNLSDEAEPEVVDGRLQLSLALPDQLVPAGATITRRFDLQPRRLWEQSFAVRAASTRKSLETVVTTLSVVGESDSPFDADVVGDLDEPTEVVDGCADSASPDSKGESPPDDGLPGDDESPPGVSNGDALLVMLGDDDGGNVPCDDGAFHYRIDLFNPTADDLEVLITSSDSDDASESSERVLSLQLPEGVVADTWSEELVSVNARSRSLPLHIPVDFVSSRDGDHLISAELVPKGDWPGDGVAGDLSEPTRVHACSEAS